MKVDPTVVIFGAGAIGSSVGGWLASVHANVYFLDTDSIVQILKKDGITLYMGDHKENQKKVTVNAIQDFSEITEPDLVVIAVKNYSLEKVAQIIKESCGDRPIIVALQNGVDNQVILPKYFSKIVYGVVCYNAWLDSPGVVGYQKKGPLILGTTSRALRDEIIGVAEWFNQGVETVVTDHLQDATHSKMVINLSNSITTLIGHPFQKITNQALFQKILSQVLFEGVSIMKAAGFHECRLGGMPSWKTISLAARLPRFITKPIFEKNVKKMVISSMAQDVLQRGSSHSELESLNGYMIKLADSKHLRIPYNRAIYALCKEQFARHDFKPMTIEEVWARIKPLL